MMVDFRDNLISFKAQIKGINQIITEIILLKKSISNNLNKNGKIKEWLEIWLPKEKLISLKKKYKILNKY